MKLKIANQKSNGSVSDVNFMIHLILIVLGAIGIPAIFLPFTWNTTPLDAAFTDVLWLLGWPGFLPVLVTAASLRWLISKNLLRYEIVFLYLVSLASICMTLSFYIYSESEWPALFREWLTYIIPLITIGFAIFVLLKTRKDIINEPFLAIIMMQFAYLANILLCLIGFFGEWEIGGYFSLVTAIVYLTQMLVFYFTVEPVVKKLVSD